MNKIYHGLLVPLFLSIGVLFILYVISGIGFIERIGDIVNDRFTYKLQYDQNRHEDDIVVIKIDDKTLDSLGKSDLGMIAFDKGVYAELIEKLFTTYNAGVLGIDVVFANPSVLGITDEQKLAKALETYIDKVVIATRSDYNPSPLCIYSTVQHGVIDAIEQDITRVFSTKPFEYDISSQCEDTIIYKGNENSISTFSREVLDKYINQTDPFTGKEIEENIKIFDDAGSDVAYIDYYSNGKNNQQTFGYRSYSFIDIFLGHTETADGEKIDLEGKIVLLGEVGTLIHDSHLTPIHQSAKMPGVEINANIITTLQTGRNIVDVSHVLMFTLFFLFQTGVIISVLYSRISLAFSVLIVSIGVLIIIGSWLFITGYIFNIFLGIIGCILALLLGYIYRFKVTDKAKRSLKKQFSSYVSPEVVDEISKDPNSILIRGEKRNMTMFFSDIVSFTSISEKYAPEVIVEILNEYFSEMTKIIYKNKGTLDKYIGDAVMCFFNAPLKQDNHSFFACKSALEQQKRLRELNVEWKKKQYPEIKIRIGLHTGEAIHGNIGSSETRVNYTVIGDSVNLASRLEGVCKQYGISICVSEDVYELQKESFHFRELDLIEVKGRKKPVKIYQLLGDKKHPLSAKHIEYFERYQQALVTYQREDFALAQELFFQSKGDETSDIMGKRCQDIQNGISRLNQGVFQLHTK